MKTLKLISVNRTKAVTIILVSILLSACGSNGFTVNTHFSKTQDVQKGVAVYFNDEVIGQVSDVQEEGEGVNVTLSLDPQAVVNIDSHCAVVINRLKEGLPLEIYSRASNIDEVLIEGQSIKGLDSMFQLGVWMLGDALEVGSGSVADYLQSFQQYLQSEGFQQDKQKLSQHLDTAAIEAQQGLKDVEQGMSDVVNGLVASEGAAAQVVEQLGDELAPVVEELASNGAQLIEQLEKFTEGLETTPEQEQQAGSLFLESLVSALEKLNESIEKGVQSSDESGATKEQQQ